MDDADETVKYPDVRVRLVGQDGNAYAIIGAVQRALRDQVGPDAAAAYTAAAMKSASYDELLVFTMQTVEVE